MSVGSDPVAFEMRGEVALVRVDDGKANALSPSLIGRIEGALDRAEKEAKAVVVAGRPGRFSAGFDLAVMGSGADAARSLLASGANLAIRVYEFPLPVVLACTGHALAMGAVMLLTGDTRIGCEGAFKIGFNEVAIGMTPPLFLVEFARQRISKRHLTRAVIEAEIYDPNGAVDAGFLDRVTGAEQLLGEALAEAKRLAGLDRDAYRNAKLVVRGESIALIRNTLEDDLAKLLPRR